MAGIGNANKAAARLVGQDTLVELVSLLNRHNTVFGAVEEKLSNVKPRAVRPVAAPAEEPAQEAPAAEAAPATEEA